LNTTTFLYIILAVIAALAIAIFQYFYKSKSKERVTILLIFLRFLGVFSLLLLCINPKIESNVLEVVKPTLVLAVDNSSSIQHLKSDADVNNFVRKIKNNNVLNDKFDIDYFSFSDVISPLDSLTFSNNSTNISNTLASLDKLYKDNTTVLLLTDGNHTIGPDYSFYKSKSQLFSIAVGDTTKYEDVKISKLNVNKYTFLGNNFPVEIFVNYDGEQSINPIVTVRNSNTVIFKKTVPLNQLQNSNKITFSLPASKIGVTNYSASISYLNNEKNTINNRKNFTVEVIDEQSKVAIVSAITHPDLGVLKRAIETNKQRKVVFLSPTNLIDVNDYQLLILYQPTISFKKIFKEIESKKINTFIITGTQTDWNFLNNAQKDFTRNAISQTEDYLAVFNPNYSAFITDDLLTDEFSPLQDYFGDVKFNIPHETLLFQNIGGFETENPLLATYTTNNRKGAILFGENIWQWRALSYQQQKSFTGFDSFINKLIQYIASTKKFNRIALEYAPIATGELKEYPLQLHKNSYEVDLSNLKSGNYTFYIKVKGQNIAQGGNFTVLDYDIEQQFTYADTDALLKLASNANGKLVHITKSNQFIQQLETSNNYKSIQKSTKKIVSLIDWEWLLGLTILLFSLEWFIRKYRGLI